MPEIFALYHVGEIERMRSGGLLVPGVVDVPEEISPHSPEPVANFTSLSFCPECLDRSPKTGLSLKSCDVIECFACAQFVWFAKAGR